MRTLMALFVAVLLLMAGALGFAYSGFYNVAATAKDPAWLNWLLITTRIHSITSRANHVAPPPTAGPAKIVAGMQSYKEMCAICHTEPGESPSPLAQGLNPVPPDLSLSSKQMSAQEMFWIIKHGIKMTGMPAWGPTHTDDQLWEIVAFLQKLPDLTPAQYHEMAQQAAKLPNTHGHHHDHGHDATGASAHTH
jgi:mono/diheme cytochrome c family protein